MAFSKHSLFNVALLSLAVITAGRVYQSQQASLSAGYPDVLSSHPNIQAIRALTNLGVVNGYPDGTYRPDRTMNRAEFTKIVIVATVDSTTIDGCLQRYQLTVRDIEPDTWYAAFVCSAMIHGYVSGYPDGTFRPQQSISFVEAAKIVASAYGAKEEQAEVWYEPYVDFLAERGAIPVTIRGFTAPITRGEMAEIIDRLRTDTRNRESLDFATLVHASAPQIAEEAETLLSLINGERIYRGLSALTYDFQLEAAAIYHAQHMVDGNFYDHISPKGDTALDRIRATGYLDIDLSTCNCKSWSYRYGENIMRTDSEEQAMAYWMNSAIHTENILSGEFIHAGVARRGRYWVVVFGGKFFEA